jgi:hypothetical protein
MIFLLILINERKKLLKIVILKISILFSIIGSFFKGRIWCKKVYKIIKLKRLRNTKKG